MKITELKRCLNSMERAELVALLCRLYKGSKQCQTLLDLMFDGEAAEDALIADCKKKIRAAFFGNRLSLKAARSVISNFRKAVISTEGLAELMLYYVECGVELTNVYGDMGEAFYASVVSMFHDYVALVNRMESDLYYRRNKNRLRNVMQDTDGIGWDFPNDMAEAYYQIGWIEEE